MSRKVPLGLALLLASAALSGCWVIDEIDSGSKWMEDHSANAKDKKAEAGAKPGATPGRLEQYIQQQEASGKTKTFTPGQLNESIVACKLGSSTQFMTPENCAARGGRLRLRRQRQFEDFFKSRRNHLGELGPRVTRDFVFVAKLRKGDETMLVAGAGQDRTVERLQPLGFGQRRAEYLGDVARDMIASNRDAAAGKQRAAFKECEIRRFRANIDHDDAEVFFVVDQHRIGRGAGAGDQPFDFKAAAADQRFNIFRIGFANAEAEHFRAENPAGKPDRIVRRFAIDEKPDLRGVKRRRPLGRRRGGLDVGRVGGRRPPLFGPVDLR